MQSKDYVPGVSGWKIDPSTGEFDLHSDSAIVRGKDLDAVYSGKSRDGSPKPVVFVTGDLPEKPQMVTVTVGEWSERDMPNNAVERYQFIGEKLFIIPPEYRESAEFSTEDHSYDRDGSDIRTTLTFSRPETAEEAAERVRRAKVAGSRIIHTNDYLTIIGDGVVRVQIGNLSQPFVVEDNQVFISETAVDDGVVLNAKLSPAWSVKMSVTDKGQYVASGIGLGLELGAALAMFDSSKFALKKTQPQTPFEKALADGDATKILDMLAGTISETELGKSLAAKINADAEQVRSVIREELRPGGLLHRR